MMYLDVMTNLKNRNYLNDNLEKDDVVLLKAANGMHFAEIFKGINN